MKNFPLTAIIHSLLTITLIFVVLNQKEFSINQQVASGFAFAEWAMQASVKVESLYEDGKGYAVSRKGTGSVISPLGLIVTNYHNIYKAQTINITLYDGREFAACLLQYDARRDLALLRIEADELPYLSLGNSGILQLGEDVFAVGNPRHLDFSLTSGIVGAFDRQARVIQHPRRVEHFIQTDVPINPGCSGGPLINYRGELVGINTAISTHSGHFEGYSFAQPVEMVKVMLSEEHWEEVRDSL